METLRTLTQEARYLLAVLAVSIVGLVVGLVVTGDEMDNLARLVFVVGIASACVMASVVLMGEARDRDVATLSYKWQAQARKLEMELIDITAQRDARISELFAESDALSEMREWYKVCATALETITRDAHKSRTPGEAFDLASYLVDYREDGAPFRLDFGGIFVGTEYQYGTWDEYDPRAIVRAIAKWNDAVLAHPTR